MKHAPTTVGSRTPVALLSTLSTLSALLVTPLASAGLTLDFVPGSFLDTNATARAAVQAAAADIDAAVGFNGGAVPIDVFTFTTSGTTAALDFRGVYSDPNTGAQQVLDPLSVATGEIRVFVGARALGGSTLGQAGPGGLGVQTGGGGSNASAWPAALAGASAAAEGSLSRGDGPVIGNLTGSLDFGAFTGTYDVDFGVTHGNLWFDSDTDNSGGEDSAATLAQNWHFDHTTPVPAGKNDFYSVALHELLHVLGIGASQSWDALVDGTTWLGENVRAVTGIADGMDLIEADGGHIAASIFSPRLTDAIPQEVVMDPNITTGTRKTLTQLDIAFLQDIGYGNTVAIPEPASAVLVLSGAVLALRRRRA